MGTEKAAQEKKTDRQGEAVFFNYFLKKLLNDWWVACLNKFGGKFVNWSSWEFTDMSFWYELPFTEDLDILIYSLQFPPLKIFALERNIRKSNLSFTKQLSGK